LPLAPDAGEKNSLFQSGKEGAAIRKVIVQVNGVKNCILREINAKKASKPIINAL
jgi:hypothetical protein